MRLARGVFYYCKTVRFSCSQHYIYGGPYRHDIKINEASGKRHCLCINHSVFYGHFGAQCLKALYMLINRPNAEITASGRRYARTQHSSQKRTEKIA